MPSSNSLITTELPTTKSMWLLLQIVSLGISIIVGNPLIKRDGTGSKFNEINTPDNRIEQFGILEALNEMLDSDQQNEHNIDENTLGKNELISKKTDHFENGSFRLENDREVRNKRSIKGMNDNERFIRKRTESASADSWLYLPPKEQVPFMAESEDLSQEKKSPSFNPWGGKRISLYKSGPNIHRPIRVPFNSWGGKRRNDDFDGKLDENNFLIDWPAQRTLLNGLEDKRVAETTWNGRRVPFSSWGGKRAEKFSILKRRKQILENDIGSEEQGFELPEEGKRGSQRGKVRVRFNSWGGKRSNDMYSFQLGNNSSSMYTTKNQAEANSDTWDDKRSLNNDVFLTSNDDSEFPQVSRRKGHKVFFSWGG